MKKAFTVLICILITAAAFAAGGCSLSDTAAYSVGGFTVNSLSTVTGNQEKVVSAGTGTQTNKNGGGKLKYQYMIFSFDSRESRNAAEDKYIEYLNALGFLHLYTTYPFEQSRPRITVNYGKKDGDISINTGVQAFEDNKLGIVIIVRI